MMMSSMALFLRSAKIQLYWRTASAVPWNLHRRCLHLQLSCSPAHDRPAVPRSRMFEQKARVSHVATWAAGPTATPGF